MKPSKKPKSKGKSPKPFAGGKPNAVGAALAAAMNGGQGQPQPPSMGPGAGMGNYPNMGM